LGLLRVSPSTEMNSETVSPIPPRCFNRRRNEISVTPAIGESTSGGLISMSRILNGSIISALSILNLEAIQEFGEIRLVFGEKILTGKRQHLYSALLAAVVIAEIR